MPLTTIIHSHMWVYMFNFGAAGDQRGDIFRAAVIGRGLLWALPTLTWDLDPVTRGYYYGTRLLVYYLAPI